MRKVFLGGALGGLPGLAISVAPLVLLESDVITSDQSQIGFVGIPLMFLGVFFGAMFGAHGLAHPGKVMLGLGVGFVGGLTVGIGADTALYSAGVTVPVLFLILPLVAMIGGAVVGAWWDEHSTPPHRPMAQH
mgnify:FL=1